VDRENSAYGYADQGADIDERQLSPSTVWRWLTVLGQLVCAHTTPSLPLPNVAARKFRSDWRKQLLARSKRILDFDLDLQRCIFPHLATG
jgi:hypothetical protein